MARKPHPGSGFIPVERPAGAVDIEDFAQAHYAVERALEYGDYGPLLARMQEGKALPDEQKLFADIYEKRLKRPRGRPVQHPEAQRLHHSWLALCVLDYRLKGSTPKVAVADAAKDANVKRSTIYKAVKRHRELFVRCGL